MRYPTTYTCGHALCSVEAGCVLRRVQASDRLALGRLPVRRLAPAGRTFGARLICACRVGMLSACPAGLVSPSYSSCLRQP